MRILSSAEKCRRVARRIFFTTSVAGSFSGTDFCLILAPSEGYDEPEILPSSTHPICLMGADGEYGWNGSRATQKKGLLIEHETEWRWLGLPEQIPCLQRTRTPSWLHAVSGSRS